MALFKSREEVFIATEEWIKNNFKLYKYAMQFEHQLCTILKRKVGGAI